MHKHHTGATIFCPACDTVLDHRRAVSIDLFKANKLLVSKVVCITCYDKVVKKNTDGIINTVPDTRAEIYNGKTKEFIVIGNTETDNSANQLNLFQEN